MSARDYIPDPDSEFDEWSENFMTIMVPQAVAWGVPAGKVTNLQALQGMGNTWYCGAWTGYGFHEDGLKSGLQVARQLMLETAERAA